METYKENSGIFHAINFCDFIMNTFCRTTNANICRTIIVMNTRRNAILWQIFLYKMHQIIRYFVDHSRLVRFKLCMMCFNLSSNSYRQSLKRFFALRLVLKMFEIALDLWQVSATNCLAKLTMNKP